MRYTVSNGYHVDYVDSFAEAKRLARKRFNDNPYKNVVIRVTETGTTRAMYYPRYKKRTNNLCARPMRIVHW